MPVPFGGRDTLIAELNQWLADTDAASNLLVTAPAGRGKTALLVRWLSQVDHDTWPIAFVPISIRYGTSRAEIFYPALAARLADILGETLPPAVVDPGSFYRDKVIGYLEMFREGNRRCVVVIDGLDEAAGWQVDTSVFPLDPLPGLRIIASARLLADDRGSAGWLRRLGWNTRSPLAKCFEVPLLDRDGIADVIEKLGFPLASLVCRVDVLAELLRLTSGEPLEIELYVKALLERDDQAPSLDVEQLRELKPGIAEFFTNWWDQQKRVWRESPAAVDEQTTAAILAVLACALGPLRLVELTRLVRQVHGIQRIFSKDTLEPIQRFIIGDGTEVGYSFSHPKLRDYFRDEHFCGGEDIERTRAGFIEWGRETVRALNEKRLTPSEYPDFAYLLKHYRQHRLAAPRAAVDLLKPANALLELVSDGWRRAWEMYEGGYQGFAADVRAAWEAVRQARHSGDQEPDFRYLGAEIRCVLCLSSICSLGTNIPADLLAHAVECGVMSARKAEYIAEQKGGEPENRVQALITLAPHFPETRKLELLDDVRALPDGRNRAQALVRLAEHLGSADERRAVLSEARSSAFDFQKPEDAAAVLASLLPLSLDDQDRTSLAYDALEIAKRIDRPATRASLLAELAPFLLPEDVSQTWAHAIDAARSENDAIPRCGAILNIALRLPKEHPKGKLLARDTIANAESTITNADRNGVHFDRIGSMAIKNWASAIAFLSNIETDPNRRAILSNEAELTARRAPEGYFRVEALTAIISYLPEPQRTEVFEDTVRLARTLPTGNNRTHALVRLAALASPDRRQDVVVEAIEASRLIEDEYGRFLALIGIAQRTGGDVSRVAVQRAEKLVDKIDYFIHKANALSQLAEFLAPPERSSAVTRALFLVLHFPNPMFRVSAIINLVPLLPTNLQKMAIERVLNNGSGDPFYALHLAHLAANVTTELLRQDVVKASLDKLQNPQMQFREEAFLELLQFVQDKGRYNALLDRVQTWIDGLRDAEKILRFAELAKLADQRGDLCEVHRLGDCIDEAIDRLDNEDETSRVLADVVATLPERLRLHFVPKAYDKCKGAKASQKRAQNLAKLVPHLGGADRAKAIAISFDAAKAVEHPTRRLEVLGMVAPLLSGVERGEAVDLLLDLCAQLGRSQAHSLLRDLPSLLPEKDHAIILLPAMAALDEMAEWFP